MSDRSLAHRFWVTLIGANAPRDVEGCERIRKDYSLWRRFWWSLLGVNPHSREAKPAIVRSTSKHSALAYRAIAAYAIFLAFLVLAGAGAAVVGAERPWWLRIIVAAVAIVAAAISPLAAFNTQPLAHHAEPPTGVEALLGKRAVVVERVDVNGGRVKIGDEIWSAKAIHPDQILEPGTAVDVIEIKGATVLIFSSD